jgi:hypothetical protein
MSLGCHIQKFVWLDDVKVLRLVLRTILSNEYSSVLDGLIDDF